MKKTISTIPVFYRSEMVADSQSFSPSAAKPAPTVKSWIDKGMPIDLRDFRRILLANLCLAHDEDYVDGVLKGRIANGFGNRSQEVAESLRFTTGSMYAAAREAIDNGVVACSPSSGFHHACYDHGGGFCTFNGLMVAALALHFEGRARRVGILDLDQHYGNGTDDIIDRRKARFVKHYTGGKKHRKPGRDAITFLHELPDIVHFFADCDVLLYQAGADPHIDDPLGGWLTTQQLLQRDQTVFSVARKIGLPVAWNLAGGYQNPIEKILEIHDNTMAACAEIYEQVRI